jgi:hypothetical protein
MSEAWTDEVLLRQLAAALDAAEAVPRDFVAAGKTAYAWHGIDTELAELAYDSDVHEDHLALARADPAVLRAMTFISAELTIEIEVTEDALCGQVVPPQQGMVHVCVRSGGRSEVVVDDVGCFLVRAKPAEPFRLHCVTATGVEVLTTWMTL